MSGTHGWQLLHAQSGPNGRESSEPFLFALIPGPVLFGDIPEYVALIAPRRLLLNFEAYDRLYPTAFVEMELLWVLAGCIEAGRRARSAGSSSRRQVMNCRRP